MVSFTQLQKIVQRTKAAHIVKSLETVGLVLAYAIAAEMLFLPCAAQVTRDYMNLQSWGDRDENDVYSDEAIETYRFIRENASEDAVIAFAKPRALYLNTQRRSFRPGINGHEMEDADYFLFCKLKYGDFQEIDPKTVQGTSVMENEWFTLYKLDRHAS